MHYTGSVCGLPHLPGLGQVESERLFTQDVSPGPDRGQADRSVRVRWGRHRYDLHTRETDGFLNVRHRMGDAEEFGAFLGLLLISTHQA